MPENPYQTTVVVDRSTTPVRLRRGRRTLLLLAAITIGLFVWEILNHNLFNGWAAFPAQVFRGLLPLILIWMIWTGRSWARYVLACYCGFTLYANMPMTTQLPSMISKGHTGNGILVVLLVVGHVVVGTMALFSQAISALMNYRRDEREVN